MAILIWLLTNQRLNLQTSKDDESDCWLLLVCSWVRMYLLSLLWEGWVISLQDTVLSVLFYFKVSWLCFLPNLYECILFDSAFPPSLLSPASKTPLLQICLGTPLAVPFGSYEEFWSKSNISQGYCNKYFLTNEQPLGIMGWVNVF